MELEELLKVFEVAAANLEKLQAIWERAEPELPTGPAMGTSAEFDDLSRSWDDLIKGLPTIDGWTITEPLPDPDELGRAFFDYAEIGEHPHFAFDAVEKPGKDLAEYRYRLNRARRRAIRKRLTQLMETIDALMPVLVRGIPRDSSSYVDKEEATQVREAIREIERLIGEAVDRRGRWSDLHRHMSFGEGHNWHDIFEMDWPTIRPDIEAALFSSEEPLPVPDIDLGSAAATTPSGPVTTALTWSSLSEEGFERLLHDLLLSLPNHSNVRWLTRTNAPDRGRDLSVDRAINDGAGGVRVERVIVQAKHWLTKSVTLGDVSTNEAAVSLWEPPPVHGLIIATSGRFTTDAVDYIEKHNNEGKRPLIDMWPESRLETLLSERPHLIAAHKLR